MWGDHIKFGAKESATEFGKDIGVAARYPLGYAAGLCLGPPQFGGRKLALHGKRCLVRRRHKHNIASHHICDSTRQERVVSAPEQEGINLRLDNGGKESLGEHVHLVASRLTPFDEFNEPRAGGNRETDRRRQICGQRLVRTTRHRANGADHPDTTRDRNTEKGSESWLKNADYGDRDNLAEPIECHRSGRVAGHNNHLRIVVFDDPARDLFRVGGNFCVRARAIRIPGGITEVDDVFLGHEINDSSRHRKSTKTRIEHCDRAMHQRRALSAPL